jgi:hypothetical protein
MFSVPEYGMMLWFEEGLCLLWFIVIKSLALRDGPIGNWDLVREPQVMELVKYFS